MLTKPFQKLQTPSLLNCIRYGRCSFVKNEFNNEILFHSQQKTIEGKTGNVIISPASIQSAVTLAMFGAAGTTKSEMLSGLKYPAGYTDDAIAKNFETFTANVKKTNGLKIGKYFWWALFDYK